MRLTTINVEKFQHDGLVVDKGWTPFNYAEAHALAQAAFRDHVGRFVRIHPDDVGELAKLGLTLEDNRIVEAKLEPEAKTEAKPAVKPEAADAGSKVTADSGNGKGKPAPADAGAKGKDAK